MLRLYIVSIAGCCLRYEVRALNLPQVSNLREVLDNMLHEGVGPTHGSAPTIY